MANINDRDIIYPSVIESAHFYILGEDDYIRQSHALITSTTPYRNNIPVNDGPMSLRLGTTDMGLYCKTCHHNKKECPTHFGHIQLRSPVQIAIDNNIMIRWLKIICFSCGSLLVDKDVGHIPKTRKLAEYVKLTRDTDRRCHKCKSINPYVYHDKFMPVDIWAEYQGEGSNLPDKQRLYNHTIVEIFERVAPETVLKLGKPLTSHPRRFMYYVVPCAPVGLRPNVIINGRPNSNDATTITKSLIAANLKIPAILPSPEEITPKLGRILTNLDMVYRALIRGSESSGSGINSKFQILSSTNRGLTGFLERLPKKTGDIRSKNLGVKTDHMCRFVIGCGTHTHIRQFGIPRITAEGMVKPMAIRNDNIEWGMMLLMNATTGTYPMIKKIHRPRTGMNMLASSFANRGNTLEIGDVVYRQIMDGDPMTFNRQPSLKRESFNTHFIKVYDQFIGEMNTSSCKLYNADFDGDAMNGILCTSQKAIAEQLILNGADGSFISSQDASPMYGFFQDTIVEVSLISRSETKFSRGQLMQYFRNLPSHTMSEMELGKDEYTGREALSMLMLPVNYTGVANYYNEGFAPYLPYEKDNVNVVINRGQIVSGIIDKKTGGQGVMGSIFHKMCSQYGPNDTLDVLYNTQHLGHEFAYDNGFTFHLGDITIAPEMEKVVKEKLDNIMAEHAVVTAKAERNELIPPIGKTVEQYYEEQVLMGILRHGDDFREPIMRSISLNNNYLIMAMHGGKGKYLNMQQVMAVIGQQNIGSMQGIRNFGFARTSSHFQRYDNDPIANGYIADSYVNGIGPKELLQAAKDSRQAIVNIALTTSKTGHSNRELCNSLQSDITNALRQTVKNQMMLQPLYGEVGVDPANMVEVVFPTVSISAAAFEEGWHERADNWKNINAEKLQPMLDAEFERIANDRNTYRTNYIALDNMSDDAYIFTNKAFVAANVYSILNDIIFDYRDEKHITASPLWLINHVEEFCNNLPYVYTNQIQMKRQTPHCEVHKKACTLIIILVRTYLSCTYVRKNNISQAMCEIAMDKIFHTLQFALIGYGICVGLNAGQSFSEPATQNMLDSHHRAGADPNKTDALTKTAELTNAKPTLKMAMPVMKLYVLEKYENDMVTVQNIANLIEVMRFRRFTKPTYNVLFESFGKPNYPEFADDSEMIDTFVKNNPANRPPDNLINWCIRFELNIEPMIAKNISMGLIIYAINANFPDIYLIYNHEFDDNIIIRCYFSNTLFKKSKYIDDDVMDDIAQKILNIAVRGVSGIISTRVKSKSTVYIDDHGEVKSKQIHYIETGGTNMSRILDLTNYFQITKCQTDSIQETEDIWGLEAARHKIMTEFITLIDGQIMPQHLRLFSDEMCAQGKVISLVGDSGMAKRERNNWLLRIAYSAPKRNMTAAAYNGAESPIYGISAPLLVGQTPRVGPLFYRYVVDEKFTSKNVLSSDDIVDAL
jgi:DNA-directed RNA polymerase II subunit RPB1